MACPPLNYLGNNKEKLRELTIRNDTDMNIRVRLD
jgi:hypothetical protein